MLKFIHLALICLFLPSCFLQAETRTQCIASERAAIIDNLNAWIKAMITIDKKTLDKLLLWPEYGYNNGLSLGLYYDEIARYQGIWNPESHPLNHLFVSELKLGTNAAVITLKRKTESSMIQHMQVFFIKKNGSWFIVGDNIVGPKGVMGM